MEMTTKSLLAIQDVHCRILAQMPREASLLLVIKLPVLRAAAGCFQEPDRKLLETQHGGGKFDVLFLGKSFQEPFKDVPSIVLPQIPSAKIFDRTIKRLFYLHSFCRINSNHVSQAT